MSETSDHTAAIGEGNMNATDSPVGAGTAAAVIDWGRRHALVTSLLHASMELLRGRLLSDDFPTEILQLSFDAMDIFRHESTAFTASQIRALGKGSSNG